MARTADEIIASLPARRRRKIEARAAELIAEETSLRALRKAKGKTQREVARKLKIGQEGVSRLEGRADLMISTLRKYVRAVGGDLVLTARFPDGPSVRIEELGALGEEPAQRKRA